MHRTRLLSLAALAVVMSCEGPKTPTGPGAPNDPSKVISDGAHCDNLVVACNKDFFFLPPMVPLALNNANFELGQFNNTLRSSIRVDICELRTEFLNAQGYPTEATRCIAGNPIKTFAAGTVNLVNLPLRQNGWWTLFNLPPDGFYYVLWDTRQSNLNVSKYYRIKVFLEGGTDPLGYADVDPMANIFQWKYTATGQVIQLVDDVMLPIPFRIEHGGGSPVCGTSTLCVSTTITNNSSTGTQSVTLEGGAGSIAGARFPNGWLPADGPQSVVVTIAQVSTAGGGSTTDPTPCHAGLALPQYRGCFSFTTTPHLNPINTAGDQFAQPVTVAVCYELDGQGGLEKFAELYASGPNEPAHALDDAPDAGLLGASSRNCNTTPPVIGSNSSNPVVQFASASWQKVKRGFASVFGVKTAYGVDLGLGGIATAFSRIGPVLTARLIAVSPTTQTGFTGGVTVVDTVRIVGNDHHSSHTLATGLGGLSVNFAVSTDGTNGTLLPVGGEGAGATSVPVTTNSLPISTTGTSGGGFAIINWTLPVNPGTYTMTVTSPALGSPVVFTSTVLDLPDLVVTNGPSTTNGAVLAGSAGPVSFPNFVFTNQGGSYILEGGVRFSFYLSTDQNIDPSTDTHIGSANLPVTLGRGQSYALPTLFGLPTVTPGVYYVGMIVDDNSAVAESNEGNNVAVVPVVEVGADATQNVMAGNEVRMLSMQTGATWRATVTPSFAPRNTFVWTDPDAANVSISAGIGYVDVHAIVGGESPTTAAEATVQGFYTDPDTGGQNPGTGMFINSFAFNIFPRNTSLAWNAVPNAVAYHVVTEFGNSLGTSNCTIPADCTLWTNWSPGSTFTTGLTHFFQFVGAQPGRWRVFALDGNGNVINTSSYVYFGYNR